ncbi:MAG TPA: glucoamylase family protein [Rhizomicrobium sp.]
MKPAIAADDAQLLDRLQRAAFGYFLCYSNPANGLVADTSRQGSPCSIAVVGFALSSWPIAVTRGWIARADAAARTLAALRFFAQSVQSDAPDAAGYRGFYYHFLDMKSGRRVWQCELSMIDTALLLAGILVCGVWFDAENSLEQEIRQLADDLYQRVDWLWAQDGMKTISQGWKPECGFLHYGWEGYNEATILYVLALASPRFALSPDCFTGWTATYQWESIYDVPYLYGGPLFMHFFSQAWIDFRGIQDGFMREKHCDYFENSRRAIAVHREYARRNPHGYESYGADFWGVTAGDGPGNEELRESGRDRRFFGYTARGVPFGPDDGTISPWAMLASLPFAPAAALAGARNLLENYPRIVPQDRFSSGFNPTLRTDRGGWLSDGWYGLDQGLLVMAIENFRSDFVWKIMRRCPYVRKGLERAGFSGGWLEKARHGG